MRDRQGKSLEKKEHTINLISKTTMDWVLESCNKLNSLIYLILAICIAQLSPTWKKEKTNPKDEPDAVSCFMWLSKRLKG